MDSFVSSSDGDADNKTQEESTDAQVADDYGGESDEVRLRRRVEKRMQAGRSALRELLGSVFFWALINFAILGGQTTPWLERVFAGEFATPPFLLWFTFILWGFAILGQVVDYYDRHGPGRYRRERRIMRELERERQLYYREDSKSKRATEPVRLSEDGEFADDYFEEFEQGEQKLNS